MSDAATPGAITVETRVCAPARLVWEMFTDPALPVASGSTTVRVDLCEQDGVTTVRLTHFGLDAAMAAIYLDGWRHYLARLTAVAAGVPPPADPAAPYAAGAPLRLTPAADGADPASPPRPPHTPSERDSTRG